MVSHHNPYILIKIFWYSYIYILCGQCRIFKKLLEVGQTNGSFWILKHHRVCAQWSVWQYQGVTVMVRKYFLVWLKHWKHWEQQDNNWWCNNDMFEGNDLSGAIGLDQHEFLFIREHKFTHTSWPLHLIYCTDFVLHIKPMCGLWAAHGKELNANGMDSSFKYWRNKAIIAYCNIMEKNC